MSATFSAAPPLRAAPRWRAAAPALLALVAAVLWLYRDTAAGMVAIWSRSETFAHAWTVPPIVAWLVWRRRHDLAPLAPRPSAWALLPLCGAGAVWLLGDLASANAVTQFAFTAMLVLAVPALLGRAITRVLAFPLGFLFFAVPVGEFLLPQLMSWTADFTVVALRLSGIPVYREGLQFVIPSGNWSVVEACSGIRYLIASVMIGVLFAHLNYRSTRRRAIFVGVAVVVPVLANWIRAYLIVLLGHVSGNRLAVGVDHLIYGWVFFGVVITLMFMIGARWAEPPAGAAVARPTGGAGPRSSTAIWATAGAAAALVIAPHLALAAIEPPARGAAPRLVLPPVLDGGWRLAAAPGVDWKPAYRGAAGELAVAFARDADQSGADDGAATVGVYLGYYRDQRRGAKLIASDNVLVAPRDPVWAQTGADRVGVALDGTPPLTLVTASLRASPHPGQPAGTGIVAWQVYWVGGAWTATDTAAAAHAVWNRLRGRGDDAAVLVLHTADDAGAADRLGSFLRANLHVVAAGLARTRDGG